MIKSKIFLLLLCLSPFMMRAQSLIDVKVTVESVTHGYECLFDEFIINNRPEPRWNVNVGSYSSTNQNTIGTNSIFINPGLNVTCGEILRNDVIAPFLSICGDKLKISIESWEDDGGLDNTYDPFGINPDQNYSNNNFFVSLTNISPNKDTAIIYNQSNGYSVKFILNWNKSASPIITSANKDTVCIGSKAKLIATHTTFNNGQFSWYEDANLAQHVFTGGTFITDNIQAQKDFWVTEFVVGGCVVAPFKTTVYTKALPAAPNVNSPSICAGKDTLLTATSLVANATYSWYADNINMLVINQGSTFRTPMINANPTKFYVRVKDNMTGCVSAESISTITLNAKPAAPLIISNSPLCDGDSLKLNCIPVGLGYAWTGPFGFASALRNPILANVNEDDHQGFYTLQTTDLNTGCKSDPSSLLVDVNRVKNLVFAFSNGKVCDRDTVKLSATSIVGATYSWTGPNGFISNVREPKFIGSMQSSGKYTVTIKLGKCFSAPVETEVTMLDKPTLQISKGDSISSDVPYIVTAISKYPVTWYPLAYFDNPNSYSARVKLPIGNNLIYCIASNQGCEQKNSINIVVKQGFDLGAVNLMTPNGDGINDNFVIPNIGSFGAYSLTIYNRGGMEVYASTSYANDWNGNWKGNLVPDGSYWWILKTTTKFYKGAITIKR